MAKSITISNIGPNELLEIPLAEGGGVTVLRGRNDLGKSEGIKAVSALAGSGEKLSVCNEAAPGTKGKVSGCGVELSVFKSTRIKGVAEFEVLDGDFSIEDVVDPGVKDPVAADVKRIKALLRVAGAEIDPQEFYGLVGGQDAFVQAVGPDETDPGVVAARVRTWLHKQANELEKESEALSNRAAGVEIAYQGVDLEAESDPSELRSRLEAAIREQGLWENRRSEFLSVTEWWAVSKEQLEAAEKEHDLNAVEEATARVGNACKELEFAEGRAISFKMQLETALKEVEHWKRTMAANIEERKQAERDAQAIDRLRKVVEAGTPIPVEEEDVEKAKQAVESAREALEAGAKVRDARSQLAAAAETKGKSKSLAKEAESCRQRAAEVNAVLNKTVEKLGVGLSVHNERLIVERGKKQKLFDEISVGARRKIALDIAIDSVGERGLITYGQDAWESLDFQARKEVNEHLISRGVNMITAESDKFDDGNGGMVRAEIYTP